MRTLAREERSSGRKEMCLWPVAFSMVLTAESLSEREASTMWLSGHWCASWMEA